MNCFTRSPPNIVIFVRTGTYNTCRWIHIDTGVTRVLHRWYTFITKLIGDSIKLRRGDGNLEPGDLVRGSQHLPRDKGQTGRGKFWEAPGINVNPSALYYIWTPWYYGPFLDLYVDLVWTLHGCIWCMAYGVAYGIDHDQNGCWANGHICFWWNMVSEKLGLEISCYNWRLNFPQYTWIHNYTHTRVIYKMCSNGCVFIYYSISIVYVCL